MVQIRVNGYTGYMMTKFLTTTQPTTISSAALNKNTVWPGETLTVTTNPANINVSYEWLNDVGARLARAAPTPSRPATQAAASACV